MLIINVYYEDMLCLNINTYMQVYTYYVDYIYIYVYINKELYILQITFFTVEVSARPFSLKQLPFQFISLWFHGFFLDVFYFLSHGPSRRCLQCKPFSLRRWMAMAVAFAAAPFGHGPSLTFRCHQAE